MIEKRLREEERRGEEWGGRRRQREKKRMKTNQEKKIIIKAANCIKNKAKILFSALFSIDFKIFLNENRTEKCKLSLRACFERFGKN